jgi:hypothetical protein
MGRSEASWIVDLMIVASSVFPRLCLIGPSIALGMYLDEREELHIQEEVEGVKVWSLGSHPLSTNLFDMSH